MKHPEQTRKRPRGVYVLLTAGVIVGGLCSRRFRAHLPFFLAEYAGDTLWALMVFLLLGILLPRRSTFTIATFSLAFSYLIEISQLYHAPWIDTIRHTALGGLILGSGFLWSDLLCYSVGTGIGVALDLLLGRLMTRSVPL